jgi:hypothetical protein
MKNGCPLHLCFVLSGVRPEDAGQAAIPVLVIAGRQVQGSCQVQAVLALVPDQATQEAPCPERNEK